jgi:branched-chain amino acid transport system ATP-binding protein
MLEVRGLRAGHDGGDVVHGVDLDVGDGEAVAVIGANGAGKTTLLRAVCGLVPASGGSVRLDGREVLGTSTHALARRGLAHVPAERHLFPRMSVRENLLLGAFPRRDDADRRALVHELFPALAARARQEAGTLSGGEQQMLALGRALMGRPRVLVLDEPSTGLAPRLATDLYRALGRLVAQGTTLLVAEQQVPLALDLVDRGYVLDRGRVAFSGTAGELADDPRVRRVHLGLG